MIWRVISCLFNRWGSWQRVLCTGPSDCAGVAGRRQLGRESRRMSVLHQVLKDEEARSGNHTPIVFRRRVRQGEKRESLTALRFPFYRPQAKGGAMTRKRRAVSQILLLYWATAARAMPCQTPGLETGSDAFQFRHGSELLTLHGACSLSQHPGAERAPSAV